MRLRSTVKLLGAIVVACALAACGSKDDSAQQVVQTKKAAKPQVAPVPEDPTASMAHAVVIGKSGASVDLKYDITAKPESGKPIEVEIALIPGVLVDSMTVNVTGTTGVRVSGGDANFGKHAIGEAARHKFSVQVDQPEVVYLTVNATAYTVGISSTRAFAIPLIVSAPAPAAAEAETKSAPPTQQAATAAEQTKPKK